MLLYLRVRFYLHAFSSNLAIELFVNELTHQFLARLSPCDVVLHSLEETDVGWSSPNEHSSVYFPEVEAGEQKTLLLGYVMHSSNSYNQKELADPGELLFCLDVNGFILLILNEESFTLRR